MLLAELLTGTASLVEHQEMRYPLVLPLPLTATLLYLLSPLWESRTQRTEKCHCWPSATSTSFWTGPRIWASIENCITRFAFTGRPTKVPQSLTHSTEQCLRAGHTHKGGSGLRTALLQRCRSCCLEVPCGCENTKTHSEGYLGIFWHWRRLLRSFLLGSAISSAVC